MGNPRVLYVIQGYPTRTTERLRESVGGAQIQAQRVAELLSNQFEMRVLTQGPTGASPDEIISGVHVSRLSLAARGGTRGAVEMLLWLIFAGMRMAPADVVQGFQLNALTLAAACIATMRRTPYIIKITGRGNFERLVGTRGRLQLRLLSWAASAIVAPSRSCVIAAREAGFPGEKVHYIPNGVDTEYFQPPTEHHRITLRQELGYDRRDFVFCWIGRLHPLKGLDCMPPAWALVEAQCPEARLLIVGDGEEEALAQSLVTLYPHSIQRLHFHQDVRAFYACADAVLLTSRSEGLSNVLLEGMACGLPGVVSSAPENAEVGMGGDFLLTFDRDSPQSVAEALIATIQRRQQPGLGQAARRHVEQHYSLSSTAAKWSELYCDLLNRGQKN